MSVHLQDGQMITIIQIMTLGNLELLMSEAVLMKRTEHDVN